jgi:hypothetical protein
VGRKVENFSRGYIAIPSPTEGIIVHQQITEAVSPLVKKATLLPVKRSHLSLLSLGLVHPNAIGSLLEKLTAVAEELEDQFVFKVGGFKLMEGSQRHPQPILALDVQSVCDFNEMRSLVRSTVLGAGARRLPQEDPHISVAQIPLFARNQLERNRSEVEAVLNQASWALPVRELQLWLMDDKGNMGNRRYRIPVSSES